MSVAKLSSLLLAVGMALPAAPVFAQAIPQGTIDNLFIGDVEQEANAVAVYINKDNCENNDTIRFNVTNLQQRPNLGVLEFWVDVEGGANCQDKAGRSRTNANENPPCTQVATTDGETEITDPDKNSQAVEFRVRDVFGDDNGTCDSVGDQYLYAVPLEQPTEEGSEQNGIGQAIRILFTVDVEPLAAPDGVSGGSGETQVTVSWDAPSGVDEFTRYQVFFDTSVKSSGTSCADSDALTPGEVVDRGAEGLEVETTPGTSISVNPTSLGLELDESVPAVVVARDAAGNLSQASEVVCVSRVETTSFWDECQDEDACREGFNTCSLSHSSGQTWLGFPLSLLGLALWMRRRRTV